MMRLQLLGVLADILVLLDLAGGLELIASASNGPLVDAEGKCNLVVIKLWYL